MTRHQCRFAGLGLFMFGLMIFMICAVITVFTHFPERPHIIASVVLAALSLVGLVHAIGGVYAAKTERMPSWLMPAWRAVKWILTT